MKRYLYLTPKQPPRNGRLLVHNFVHATWENQTPGMLGFRVWTQRPDDAPKVTRCACGWSGLPHYRGPNQHGYGKPPSVKGKRRPASVVREDEAMGRAFGGRWA